MRLIRVFLSAAILAAFSWSPVSAVELAPSYDTLAAVAQAVGLEAEVYEQSVPEVQQVACCKICSKGKACGDSCISRSYNCTKGPGCACNGYAPIPLEPEL
jgi:hypothetical protein